MVPDSTKRSGKFPSVHLRNQDLKLFNRKQFQKILTKQGLKFKLNTKVLSAEKNNGKISVKFEGAKGGNEESMDVDVVLVAVGRRPVTEGLNLDKIGVEVDNRGRIVVDDQFNTSVKGIKCIGDATFGPMLAHKAEEEGMSVSCSVRIY